MITAPDGQQRHATAALRRGGGGRADADRAAAAQAAVASSRWSAPRSGASTRSTSSPAASSSRWTSTSRTRCRRWSAGRRRSTARAVGQEPRRGQGDARRHRRRDHPAHQSCRRRRRARRDVRPVHRRGPRARGRLGRRDRWTASPTPTCSPTCKAAELPLTPALAARQDDRPALHVPLPPGRPARDQLRGRRRAGRPRRDLVEPEVADLGPGAARDEPRAAGRAASRCTSTQGGGSFGRHLFSDAAFEAAAISKKIGKPVKLMWHRTDNFRQGRVHPMCTSRVRDHATWPATCSRSTSGTRASRPTSRHGLGELLTRDRWRTLPEGDFLGYSQSVFTLTAERAATTSAPSRSCSTRSTTTTRSTPAACATSTAPT